jgi:two-component system chemotaxis response regulator CheY
LTEVSSPFTALDAGALADWRRKRILKSCFFLLKPTAFLPITWNIRNEKSTAKGNPMAMPVLVVDDSTLARKLLIHALPEDWDVEVSEAKNGLEALAAPQPTTRSVMFLDLTMPGMTGFDVLLELRKRKSSTCVIVVSADVQAEAKERVKASGAVAFVSKPVSREKLLPILKEQGLYA